MFWRFTWHRLAVAFPTAGTWINKRAGSVTWETNHILKINHLTLVNGIQILEIPEAVLGGNETQLSFFARQMDPGPWATFFCPGLLVTGGMLNASLHMSGTPPHRRVEGFLTGKIQKLEYDPLDLALQMIDIDIQGEGRHWHVRHFTGKTKKGDVQITGESLWPALDYTLHGRELTVRLPPSMNETGNLEGHLGGTVDSPEIRGQVTIREAVYVLPKEKESKSPPKMTAPPEPHQNTPLLWEKTQMDVRVQWPRNVWYRDGVTGIETRGDLRVQKYKYGTNLILSGTITSIRGTYNYFGRDFNIDTGQIQFTGTPQIDPALNVGASYRGDAATVYLDITGSLTKPTLKLRSNPPLPEQDIISVMVFGQPLSELRSRTGGQTANQQMMQAVGGVLGSYVTKELRQTGFAELHIDLLNLAPTQQGSQLTVGRYLGRRLFVTYGQAIRGSAEKSVTADYFLTDKWTLQGASDSTEGNTLDFLFRYPLKKGSPTDTHLCPHPLFEIRWTCRIHFRRDIPGKPLCWRYN